MGCQWSCSEHVELSAGGVPSNSEVWACCTYRRDCHNVIIDKIVHWYISCGALVRTHTYTCLVPGILLLGLSRHLISCSQRCPRETHTDGGRAGCGRNGWPRRAHGHGTPERVKSSLLLHRRRLVLQPFRSSKSNRRKPPRQALTDFCKCNEFIPGRICCCTSQVVTTAELTYL